MKIQHKLNPGWHPPPVIIDDAYQRQIDETLRRARRDWEKASKAADRAERLAARRAADINLAASAADLRRAADARWRELKEHEALMVGGVSGHHHSGRGSVRRVGNKGTL